MAEVSPSPKDGCYYRRAPYEEREKLKAFAMAACTLGAVLRPRESYMDRAYAENGKKIREVFWFFEPITRDKKYHVRDLWIWWNDEAWRSANPEHPLTVARQMWLNLLGADEFILKVAPKVMISGPERYLFLPRGISAAERHRALEVLQKQD